MSVEIVRNYFKEHNIDKDLRKICITEKERLGEYAEIYHGAGRRDDQQPLYPF